MVAYFCCGSACWADTEPYQFTAISMFYAIEQYY
jgi:hypothetical protein